MLDHDRVRQRFEKGALIFDGALGSLLIARGLPSGSPPEEWNRTRPDVLEEIHLAYLEAGADVVSTNTFGGTPSRLREYGLGDQLAELNNAGVRLARHAVAELAGTNEDPGGATASKGSAAGERAGKFIALSIGPTGMMLPPVGKATESGMREEFTAQLQSITEPFDFVVIETMFDLEEALIALRVAKGALPHPVAVTLTYNKNRRGFFTVMGNEAGEATRRLEDAGADVVGANCSIASGDMLELAGLLRESTALPVLCQPNAGNPKMKGGTPVYGQTPEEFAADANRLFEKGINAVGGCCGTTPEFIRELAAKCRGG